jgi:hypothetical protein
MIRRGASLLVRWIGGLAAGLALFAVFLVWRLSAGPVSLDYLTPFVAQSIAAAGDGLEVGIDHTFVSLSRDAGIEIVARGVRLHRRSDEARLTLPELAIALSPRAALRGIVAPTRIVLDGPELRLERAADGSIRFGLGTEAPAAGDWAETLLRELAAPPDRKGRLGFLAEVAVHDARLRVEDRALRVAWQARRMEARLRRGAAGITGDAALVVSQPDGAEADLHGNFRYASGEDHLDIQLGFSDLRPAVFATAAPALAPLAALQLPFRGQLLLTLDTAAFRIDGAWGELSLGAGRIEHPALAGGVLGIASGRLRAAYDPAQGRVTIEQLALDLAGPLLELTGTVDGLGGNVLLGELPPGLDIAAELRLRDVPVDDLPRFWPERLAPRTRSWIEEHIHDGIVSEASAHLAGHVDLAVDAPRPIHLETFAGTLAYRNLTVEYFKPLPPLRGVDGAGVFDRSRLDLVPSAGAVENVQLAGGAAKLSQLDTDDEQIAIDLGVRGPLRDVLDVLDTKPLRYAHELKLDPAQVAGQVDGRLTFSFPLKHDLTLDMVDFGARAALRGVALAQVVDGHDLTAGDLRLQLDRAALRLDGTARLADIPAKLSWMRSLKPESATRARYTVEARLDDAARQHLGLDLSSGLVQGPVDAAATVVETAGRRATANISLDLKDASLDVARLNWRKPAGTPLTAAIDLDLLDEHIRAVRQATAKGGGLDARLAVAFGNIGGGATGITGIDLPRFIIGETDVSGTVTRRAEGGWRVELKGLAFDASGLLADVDRSGAGGASDPPLVIDAAFDRLVLGPKREARNVKGQLYSDGRHWQAASLDATMFGGGKASLRFGEAAGDRSFRLATDDFGALLRLLGISENVAAGQLEVTGLVEDQGPRRVFRGKVQGADYRVVGAPLFAKLLSVASFSGVGALLSGEGIPFARLYGDFTLADGKLELRDMRAYGGAIGVTANGTVDLAGDALDISGTLVPAYTINSILGSIPLLGKVLVGSEGGGLFAANFRVAGPTANAAITVNPLSALAPGVLRKLFLFDAPEPVPPASPKTSPD